MKMTILGCGNAFSLKNGNTSFLLEDIDGLYTRRLLVDAGFQLPAMLQKNNIDVKSITDVYISHLHSDHMGGLEYLALNRYDWENKPDKTEMFTKRDIQKKLKVNLPDITGVSLFANHRLMDDLWEKSLRGGLEAIEDKETTLETFFVAKPVHNFFYWCNWKVELVQQIHVMTGSIVKCSFGLFFTRPNSPSIYIVTDSQFNSPKQHNYYQNADYIFQDCELIPYHLKTGVHANYTSLMGLTPDIKAKMWLTHYQDFYNDKKDFYGENCDWDYLAEQDGFAGFVRQGNTFNF